MSEVDPEFLLISEAVARLERGMYGGDLKRPKPVEIAKKYYRRASIGFGVQKQTAAAAVNAAITSGVLSVNVFVPLGTNEGHRPLQVPLDVLGQLLRIRGSLPDEAIRPPVGLLRNSVVAPELFAGLSNSPMYLKKSEFDAWYDKQKSRGRWPSQRGSKKSRIGRPSKQRDGLRTSIIARIEEGSWSATMTVATLADLLVSKGVPTKRNTLKRAVDQLYNETGDPRYRIVQRRRTLATPTKHNKTGAKPSE
ncbi:hypothetical protein ACQR13_21650 [Bradyrhizobium sp. HKCCYLRH3059]|uniref:hypothetical protein n=1 Tax=Bradyrhizobium sp. HKCCYLRH3059 TaxID=3420745 RepID=UPI003EBD2FB7